MTENAAKTGFFARAGLAAVALYVLLAGVFAATIWFSIADILAQRAAVAASVGVFERLEARRQATDINAPAGAGPAGSPFLGGETITVAGAALLQRVAGAVTRFGGNVQSSQVDLRSQQAKADVVTLIMSFEIGQENLQKLLYDIEAGMPYLFIDQLVAQAPQGAAAAQGSRMGVLLAVSGRWSGKR